MSALAETLRALAAVLDARQIDWYVFGAQAVAVRGAPRATQDIDITASVELDGIPKLLEALAGHGLTPRYPELVDELLASGSVVPLGHVSGMEVDLVFAGSGLEELASSRATREDIDGVRVPVVHATDLVVAKMLAGRGKDLDDVRAVLASGDVDLVEARDLLSQLEQALGQSTLLLNFEAAIKDALGES